MNDIDGNVFTDFAADHNLISWERKFLIDVASTMASPPTCSEDWVRLWDALGVRGRKTTGEESEDD